MLKQRVITGLIMAVIAFLAVRYLSPTQFAVVSLIVIVGLGSWEWAGLTGVEEGMKRMLAPLPAIVIAQFLLITNWPLLPILVISVLVWLAILFALASYHGGRLIYKDNPIILRAAGVLVLVPAWYALAHLHHLSYAYVFYVIALVAAADTGAYFAGKCFGRSKLAPDLSPGKTREGFFGGLAAVLVLAVACAPLTGLPTFDKVSFVLLSLVAGILSVAGDLFESLLKREAGAKDSGNILPGHGGILDRIDSLVAAVPIFTLGLLWIMGVL